MVGVSTHTHSEGFCVGVQASAGCQKPSRVFIRKACIHMFIEASFIMAKNKQSRCSSTGEWLAEL